MLFSYKKLNKQAINLSFAVRLDYVGILIS